MASCKACAIPITEDGRKYCCACYELLIAVMKVPDLCANCHVPLDDKRDEVYELINESNEVREFCAVCWGMIEVIGLSPYWVALSWAAEEKKKQNRCTED